MKDKLQEIDGINGVFGAFLFFNDGEVVYNKAPEAFDDETMFEIGQDAIQASASFDRIASPLQECDTKYENMRVIFYTRNGYHLVVCCKTQLSISMLRMTINVVLNELEGDRKFQKRINKMEATRSQYLVRSQMDSHSWELVRVIQ